MTDDGKLDPARTTTPGTTKVVAEQPYDLLSLNIHDILSKLLTAVETDPTHWSDHKAATAIKLSDLFASHQSKAIAEARIAEAQWFKKKAHKRKDLKVNDHMYLSAVMESEIDDRIKALVAEGVNHG